MRNLRFCLTLSCTLLCLATTVLPAQVAPRPPVNQRWIINEDYTDEFNGTKIDLAKWYDYHPRWTGRAPAIFLPSQVSVAGGSLQIKNAQLPRDTTVTLFNGDRVTYSIGGGAVVSRKTTAHYGYYEVNMLASRIKMSSTFWFSNPPTSGACPTFSNELDVIEAIGGSTENPSFTNQMKSNTHYFERDCNGNRVDYAQPAQAPIGGNVADAYHRYGVWWKNGLEMDFYIDGVKTHSITRRADKPLEREMHLNMVTETYDWQPPPTAADLADDSRNTTYYDYVRGMQLVDIDAEVPADAAADGNLVKNPGFETGDFTDWIGWGGNPREVVMNNQHSGSYAVRIVGGGAPEQVIDVTPNTEYTLSCMAKIVSGQISLGVKPTDANEAIAAVTVTGAEYAEHSVTFNSGNRSQVKIYFFAMAGGNEGFADDFSVLPLDGGEGGGNEPEPVRYVQFSEGVEFLDFPRITNQSTSIRAHLTYQANTDHELTLVLRDNGGTEVSRQTYPAKAGYGRRLADFPLANALADGMDYTLNAELRPVGGGELAAVGRLLLTVGGSTTGNRNPQRPQPAISPNPVRDELSITGVAPGSNFRIYGFTGRRIRSGSLAGASALDLRSLRAGAYLLVVENHAPVRFVKQ